MLSPSQIVLIFGFLVIVTVGFVVVIVTVALTESDLQPLLAVPATL
jgi:hypothetical protein